MSPRTALAILGAALAGFGAGAMVTREPATTPPGRETSKVWEDGSWAITGCMPAAPCSLPMDRTTP
jgi:hypothetical protein